jgi:hypothetical protein
LNIPSIAHAKVTILDSGLLFEKSKSVLNLNFYLKILECYFKSFIKMNVYSLTQWSVRNLITSKKLGAGGLLL